MSRPQQFALVLVFTLLSCLSFVSLHRFPSLQEGLFPILTQSNAAGATPDGVILRSKYTGHRILDAICRALVSFFVAVVDGKDEALQKFALWFVPQISVLLVFWYWETGRAKFSPVRSPVFFGLVGQLLGMGFAVPFFFTIYVLSLPIVPTTLPRSAIFRSQTILPAILLGFILPSIILFMVPMSMDAKQIIAGIWQTFPIYVSILHLLFRGSSRSSKVSKTNEAKQAFTSVKTAYIVCGLICSISHLTVLIPSLFTSNPDTSFAHILLPIYVHPYLPTTPVPSSSLPPYRLLTRVFLQHDYFGMTIPTFVFFAWSNYASLRFTAIKPRLSMTQWLLKMTALCLVGGPGAAFSWAAIKREEQCMNRLKMASKKK